MKKTVQFIAGCLQEKHSAAHSGSDNQISRVPQQNNTDHTNCDFVRIENPSKRESDTTDGAVASTSSLSCPELCKCIKEWAPFIGTIIGIILIVLVAFLLAILLPGNGSNGKYFYTRLILNKIH